MRSLFREAKKKKQVGLILTFLPLYLVMGILFAQIIRCLYDFTFTVFLLPLIKLSESISPIYNQV